jgi:hypothetical protein
MKPSPHPPRTRLRLRSNASFFFWAVLTALFAFVPALVPSASAATRYKVLSRDAPSEQELGLFSTESVLKPS